jgi:thiamine kinase-like enzyme
LGGKREENGEQRAVRGGENAKTTRNDDWEEREQRVKRRKKGHRREIKIRRFFPKKQIVSAILRIYC